MLVKLHGHLDAILLDEFDHCDSAHPDGLEYLVAVTLRAIGLEFQPLNLVRYLGNLLVLHGN